MIKNSDLITIDSMKEFYKEDINVLLHKILLYARSITSCDAGTIYLKDNDTLSFSIFQNDSFSKDKIKNLEKNIKSIKFKIEENTNTIAIESIIQSKIITVDDIYLSKEFNFLTAKEFDKNNGYKTKSILTAPLINNTTNEIIGVIQLLNKLDDNKNLISFDKKDKEFISMSSYFITLSIINSQNVIKALKQSNKILEEKVKERTKKLEIAHEKLIELANKDPMTKLFNRRYLQDITSHLLNISKRLNTPICIMLIDIDDFKCINDTYGHAVGDNVIISLSKIFKNNTRESDISIRFGGEEFVILLPNTTKDSAISLANKIRIKTKEQVLKIYNEKISFTISIGVSIVNSNDKSFDTTLNKADKALYVSKENGKNQVSFLE
jgi:diguanylate cyclase (GGDEF)-like protein